MKLDDDILEVIEKPKISDDEAEASKMGMNIAVFLAKMYHTFSILAQPETKREEVF